MSRISQQLPSNSDSYYKGTIVGDFRPSLLNPKVMQEISQKKDLEWVLALISDLQKAQERDFAQPLTNFVMS